MSYAQLFTHLERNHTTNETLFRQTDHCFSDVLFAPDLFNCILELCLPLFGEVGPKMFKFLVELRGCNFYEFSLILNIVFAHLTIEDCLEGIEVGFEGRV